MAKSIASRVPELIAAVAAVVGLVVYLITSTTGYLAGKEMNVLPIVCTVLAVVALLAMVAAGPRLGELANDALLIASEVLLVVSFALFTLDRVSLAADIYFIPVNYPASEQSALNISLVGVVAYLVAIVLLIVKAFTAKTARGTASITIEDGTAPAVA
ncbi:hypothetical protein [Bifidobacterium eulemuris]|uniref:Sodium:proton antiporter n=1 Tax=Bifidobacterium eulemuris TaxID=1765219 RepID=A0A261G1F4_9BIFI|nr:hypothetical protein [Bifidobacterium eulemuris]OZG65261.1 sodium:proton antiporter [Bifidobacterium eulemuris]QOL32322.1 hypothetical protein BE0216_07535 [Bifidobacterium eulemuris]